MKKGKGNKLAKYALGGVFEGFSQDTSDGIGGGRNYKKDRRRHAKAKRQRMRKCRNGICRELNTQG